MKPMNCDEMESSIPMLGQAEIPAGMTQRIVDHLNQCDACREQYAGFRDVLLHDIAQDVKEPDDAFFDALPGKVLAQVNEFKLLINTDAKPASPEGDGGIQIPGVGEPGHPPYEVDGDASVEKAEQGESASNTVAMSDFRRPRSGKLHLSFLHGLSPCVPPKVLLPLAASILIVVSIVVVMQKPADEFQHQTAVFQRALLDSQPSPGFAEIIENITRHDSATALYAFGQQSTTVTPFSVGNVYSETLALLDAQDRNASYKHFQRLQQQLADSGVAEDLGPMLRQAVDVLSRNDSSRAERVAAVDAFASVYVKYLQQNKPQEIVYFRLGTWSNDIALAAASKNDILRAELPHIDYFLVALTEVSAPMGIIASLEEMRATLQQPAGLELDYNSIFQLCGKIRRVLT